MPQRVVLYISAQSCSTGTYTELRHKLTQTVENRGDIVVGAFADDRTQDGRRHQKSGWKALLGDLDGIDQVAAVSAGDLPGRSVKDLLKVLDLLRENDVGLFLATEGIDTANGSAFTVLEIVRVYRAAKLSQAIKIGQVRAVEAGKRIGRPDVPANIRNRIQASLASGGGIRATAKRYGVSPGTVINIRRSMIISPVADAA